MNKNSSIGFAGNRTAYYVANTQNEGTMFFCFPDCRKRVGRFSGLTDCNNDVFFIEYRMPVSEFGCVFDLNGDACKFFY